jgi:hypothetical protein
MIIEIYPHHFLYIYIFIAAYLIIGVFFFYKGTKGELQYYGLEFKSSPVRHIITLFIFTMVWPLVCIKVILKKK